MRLYRDRYGFIENSEATAAICPSNKAGSNLIAMKKPNLVLDKSKIDFQFLRRKSGGRKTRKTRKNKRK
jgi:hypothetical protein